MPLCRTRAFLLLGLSMAINNSTKVKDLVDMGMEKDFLESEEASDFLPRESFSPEDAEDAFDFLSESDTDIFETIQGTKGSYKEESMAGGDVEKRPSETTDDAVLAYLKDMGRMPLLTADEEYQIAKKIKQNCKNCMRK